MSLDWADSRLTVWSPGMVRRMSMSLRAPTVVVKLPVSPPSSAVVRIWISRSLVVSCTHCRSCGSARWPGWAGVAALHDAGDRLQNRSTLSCVAFRTIMSTSLFLERCVDSSTVVPPALRA
jgi:hypothetical protein